MNDWNPDNDRRRHFRISEPASVDYRITEDAIQPLDSYFANDKNFVLSATLREIEEEADPLLRQLHSEDKTLSAYLRLQNRKIELIAQALSNQAGETFSNPITLSEGGISFIDPSAIDAGTELALALKLLPTYLGLLVKARVVYSQPVGDNTYRVGCEFIDLADQQLHHLRRHTLESQARARREAANSPD